MLSIHSNNQFNETCNVNLPIKYLQGGEILNAIYILTAIFFLIMKIPNIKNSTKKKISLKITFLYDYNKL